MNKHIELVKNWLANPESVSQEELEARCLTLNRDDAVDYAVLMVLEAALGELLVVVNDKVLGLEQGE